MKFRSPRSRRGGAVATFIDIFIVLMVALAIANSVLQLLSRVALDLVGQDRGDCGTGGATSVDTASKSAVLSELRNSTFTAMVKASTENTTRNLLQDTVMGYMDKEQEWRNWGLQYMPGAARWADTGFGPYIDAQVVLLQARALAIGNVTEAFGVLEDQVSRALGVVGAGVDFVFFNSATGLRTYLETGSFTQALCSTYASQLQQLWDEAFNPNLTERERARYLGQALAISTITVALAGADGVSSKFKAALVKVGMADSLGTVKPYLGKIGNTVSAKAAYLTFTMLEKLSKKFPQRHGWIPAFTSDRVDAMAQVLEKKGFSNVAIEQRLEPLAEDVDGAKKPDDIAYRADKISYDDGGGIRMKVGSQNRLWLYSDADTMQYEQGTFLKENVPGLVENQVAFLKVTYWERGVTVYHYYEGGENWIATVPGDVANPGDEVTVTIQVLTRADFVKNLPTITLANDAGRSWVADVVTLTNFELDGETLRIYAQQEPAAESLSQFAIVGTAFDTLGFSKGTTYLDFSVRGFFGETKHMRIYHNGYGPQSLGILYSQEFVKVKLVSYDGVRLRIVYTPFGDNVLSATLYLQDPSILYALGESSSDIPVTLPRSTGGFFVKEVTTRDLENSMLIHGSLYDVGRLGAEISYTIVKEKLRLKDVILAEPSQIGADLYTLDGKVAIQSRLLTATQTSSGNLNTTLQGQIADMLGQLREDFRNRPAVSQGFLILSYLDRQNMVRSIVLEVPRSRGGM